MIKKTGFVLVLLFVLIASPLVQAQTAPFTGMTLTDTYRGIEFSSPSELWGINAGKYSISLNHNTHVDAHVTLKKSWYTVASAQEAYEKRKNSLKSYLPGALYIKENQAISLSNNIPAVSMTYKNPSDLKVIREIMFVHKGQAYELVFQAKEENFQTVKDDFGFILSHMKLN